MRKYAAVRPSILVVGDLMLDHYLWGKTDRISPEAPVPVIDVQEESEVLGGAGNVVNNLIALGADVSVASAIGKDENGKRLAKMLKSLGVRTDALVAEPERKTTRKSRVIASHQQVIRFDSETRQDITKETEEKILASVQRQLFVTDIILLSDYGKGVLSERLTQQIIQMARATGVKVLVDPKGKDYAKYSGATLVTPNKKEASEATGIDIVDTESLGKAGFWLKNELNLDMAMITLSEEGMAIFDETMRTIPTVAREVYDVTGAGDTVLGTLGFVLAAGGDIDEAARIANAAAAVVVGKLGSATASWDEIIEYETTLHESTTEHRIKSREALAQSVERLKNEGKRIVFTNGCFDILHLGHVKYLEKAKSFGDALIVGVNSDASVRRLKGESRPVNPEYDRAYLLAALDAVDFVTIFDEDTPYDLIKIVEPDVLVKGGDYEGKEVVGSDIAKEVRLVDFVDGKSTTKIIEKINDDKRE
ncbi:D-glycero-beta-D-manno-heptose-7-phosphate kinase [Hydrogenimonas cancrithermarum]|uniref:Bifunctional protein HldE n=1 Tax=Hydrogenimonas cancrithermarum TaxID=2993563 RepID=A0ABM8FM36_9BACT|nr:D-glycero-beta-D-manno-heptose-7-phosphate kinase [Hydrogenimonas cancrithermarum]BDY13436.1 bifunctional protein HldE [Hydrogenimonas cancrithermarum]